MRKRVITILLSAALLLSLLAGCAGTEAPTESEQQPSETPQTVSESPVEELSQPSEQPDEQEASAEPETPEIPLVPDKPVEPDAMYPLSDGSITLTYFSMLLQGITSYVDEMNDIGVFKKAQEVLGVNIDWVSNSVPTLSTNFNLMLASGDFTDLTFWPVTNYSGSVDRAVEDDIYLRLNEYMERYAPHYWEIINTDESLLRHTTTDSGNIVTFYQIFQEAPGLDFGYVTRQDLLDEAGLDVPVTYDDWHEMLLAYKGLGIEVPTTKIGDIGNVFFSGFGISIPTLFGGTPFYQIDGKLHCSWLEDGYRDYLETSALWYSEGLVDEQWNVVGDMSAAQAKNYSGVTGVWTSYADAISLYDKNTAVPGSTLVALPDPVKAEGDVIHMGYLEGQLRTDKDIVGIFSSCQYPELACQVIDFFYYGYGAFLMNWGFEGEAHELDDQGHPYFTDLILDNPDAMTYENACNLYTGIALPGYFDYERLTVNFTDVQKNARVVWNQNRDGLWDLPPSLSLTAEESEQYSKLMSDINTYISENEGKFITGDKPIAELDAVVAQLYDMGIEECMAFYQAAYERYLQR